MRLLAQGRSEDKLGFVPALAGHLVFDGEDEVLRAGLGEGAGAACLHELEFGRASSLERCTM